MNRPVKLPFQTDDWSIEYSCILCNKKEKFPYILTIDVEAYKCSDCLKEGR